MSRTKSLNGDKATCGGWQILTGNLRSKGKETDHPLGTKDSQKNETVTTTKFMPPPSQGRTGGQGGFWGGGLLLTKKLT